MFRLCSLFFFAAISSSLLHGLSHNKLLLFTVCFERFILDFNQWFASCRMQKHVLPWGWCTELALLTFCWDLLSFRILLVSLLLEHGAKKYNCFVPRSKKNPRMTVKKVARTMKNSQHEWYHTEQLTTLTYGNIACGAASQNTPSVGVFCVGLCTETQRQCKLCSKCVGTRVMLNL